MQAKRLLIPALFIAVVWAMFLSRGADYEPAEEVKEVELEQPEMPGEDSAKIAGEEQVERSEAGEMIDEDNSRVVSVSGVVRYKTGEPAPGQKVRITLFHGADLTKKENLGRIGLVSGMPGAGDGLMDEKRREIMDIFKGFLPEGEKINTTVKHIISDGKGMFSQTFTYASEPSEAVDTLTVRVDDISIDGNPPGDLIKAILTGQSMATIDSPAYKSFMLKNDVNSITGVVLELDAKGTLELVIAPGEYLTGVIVEIHNGSGVIAQDNTGLNGPDVVNIKVPAGEHLKLKCFASGYYDYIMDIAPLELNERRIFHVVLSKGNIRLSGRVILAKAGMPVNGATISVTTGRTSLTATSDEMGNFNIDGLTEYDVNLTCYRAGYAYYIRKVNASGFVTIVLNKASEFPADVAEDGSVTGDAADPSGK